ncbi:MAG: hypothetical protein H0V03_12215, partial [Thermoleophilaceae bacterium]|nr:hypothetical protein [Thermoleophilaceae bacterium]
AEELTAASYERLRERLLLELAGAEAEAARLGEQERLVREQGTLGDAEAETLRRLARIREAIAGRVKDAKGVEAVRAALVGTFEKFVLYANPGSALFWYEANTHPGRTPLDAGGGLVLEPWPRRELLSEGRECSCGECGVAHTVHELRQRIALHVPGDDFDAEGFTT